MLLEGKNVLLETINAGKRIYKVIIKESFDKDILNIIKKNNLKYEILKDNVFKTKYPHAQGVIIEAEDFKYDDFNKLLNETNNQSLVLILDGVTDPQNFGNMIRTFEALGGSFIITQKNRCCSFTDTVARVSSGAFNYTKICQVTNINQAIDDLKEKGFWVAGTTMNADYDYDKISVDVPLAIVIGNEGTGMSRLTKEKCDYMIKIPMVGKINSLNASISAAIILSNIQSRRNLR